MRLKTPVLQDLDAAFGVIAAREIADLGIVESSVETGRDLWQSSQLDLSSDVRLVEDDAGRTVAYGMVEAQGSFGAVRPDAEGRGAGTLLLDWLEQRERERGHPMHRQLVPAANHTAAEFLRARGYALTRSLIRMVASLGDATVGEPPAGVTLRQPTGEDAASMNALDNRAFAADPGYVPESLTVFREEHLEAHDAAPDLSLVACEEDRIVGFLLASRRGTDKPVGYINILGVDPASQGRGIGRALLLSAFAGFAAAGLTETQLTVSSVNPRALKLYESAGMLPTFRHDIYERPANK